MDSSPRIKIYFLTNTESHEYYLFLSTLEDSGVVAVDVIWNPITMDRNWDLPILQIATRTLPGQDGKSLSLVFLLDRHFLLLVGDLIKQMFRDFKVLKVGFRIKNDFSSFVSAIRTNDCFQDFHMIQPFLDITTIYHHLKNKCPSRKRSNIFVAICEELLGAGVSLSKEFEFFDWSITPLSGIPIEDAAKYAHYLLEIFAAFYPKLFKDKNYHPMHSIHAPISINGGRGKFYPPLLVKNPNVRNDANLLDEPLAVIVRKYCEKIVLKGFFESRTFKQEVNNNLPNSDASLQEGVVDKFLADGMLKGLAKDLRFVGIDVAVPRSENPKRRELIEQANEEGRIILTRSKMLWNLQHSLKNVHCKVYIVKRVHRIDQLFEVVQYFNLKIYKDQALSRCLGCNGKVNKEDTHWKCMNCEWIFWKGFYKWTLEKFSSLWNDQLIHFPSGAP